ncbi:restriction endonuclease subunit S [Cryobacterium sp. TMT1-19]|uniref:restriction endonuclease subunit S n=1 Tax=Cryobacterium sp. TMT1-19 TaxID=1259231 RepID=UPI00106D2769|nr:restriction endonuclease subunit S [Cryobacterium sp. TMT1-19]TFD37777.1 restriction endonuclease subunit S [Cryobacterium sp. TMT1-19]
MSRIAELIAEYCPNGVEYKQLSELANTVPGLSGKSKADFQDGNARFASYRNIFANPVLDLQAPDLVKVKEGEKQNSLQLGDILFTGSSESFDEVGMSSVVTTEPQEPIYLNSFCFIVRPNRNDLLDPEFAKHLFRSESVRKQIRGTANGVTRINISKPRFMKVSIPVPPLEVQRAIVETLDSFSLLEAKLGAALEAELDARRQQHAYYRRVILKSVGAASASLASLGKWQGGITPSKSESRYWANGDMPWLASMDISDESTDEIRGRVTEAALKETSLKIVPAPAVAVVMRSNILRRRLPIGLVKVDTTVNQDIRALIPREGVDPEYVFQVLRADSEEIRGQCVRTDGSMAALNSQEFFAWEIPLPSLEEQRSIAAELRSFEVFVDDLVTGLPTELAARRTQYEYHRDRLLAFKELNEDAT